MVRPRSARDEPAQGVPVEFSDARAAVWRTVEDAIEFAARLGLEVPDASLWRLEAGRSSRLIVVRALWVRQHPGVEVGVPAEARRLGRLELLTAASR